MDNIYIGSVLGRFCSLSIYVNDINRHVHLGSCSIYADDTLIYCTGNNITELKYNIQKCVTDVHEWYESNKLVINTSKSNVMLLTTRQMLSNMRDTALNVFIGNHKLPQCNSIKYLGVDIDNVLSWNLQTDSISKKLVFIISRLSRLKPVLPSQMLMYIYTSIIQPKIDYAISIWGYTTAHNINKVQRLQNRAARILTGNFDYVNTRCIDLVKNLGLMNVTQRRDYFMIIMMFKSIHGLVPDYAMRLLCSGTLLIEQRGPQLTIMYMCHILYLNVVKMHLPIEVRFYGMSFQKILRNAKR